MFNKLNKKEKLKHILNCKKIDILFLTKQDQIEMLP